MNALHGPWLTGACLVMAAVAVLGLLSLAGGLKRKLAVLACIALLFLSGFLHSQARTRLHAPAATAAADKSQRDPVLEVAAELRNTAGSLISTLEGIKTMAADASHLSLCLHSDNSAP